jgi:hypothetical protein
MDKVYVVYWSQTGNTEAMANMLKEGIEANGAVAELVEAGDADVSVLLEQKGFALGCPAMGSEELEDSVVEPLVASLEGKLDGKSLVLFGSYDWGDGEWMRTWVDRMVEAGATIIGGEGVIANNEPDGDAEAALKAVGAELAAL